VLLHDATYWSEGYFVNLVNFYLSCVGFTTSQAYTGSVTTLTVNPDEADVVNLSSSDTEEALGFLSLCPARGPCSPLLNLHSSFGSDLFKDWPEPNDIVTPCISNLYDYVNHLFKRP
jgi:hypothetical protein